MARAEQAVARRSSANKKLSKPGTDFAKRVAEIVEGSQYKYVDEVVDEEGEEPEEGRTSCSSSSSPSSPSRDNADRALTYAMIIFQEANELDKAIAARRAHAQGVPRHHLRPEGQVRPGQAVREDRQLREVGRRCTRTSSPPTTLAAGDKAIGCDNMKDLLKKEKEQAAKDAKAKGKKADKPGGQAAKPEKVDAKVAEQRAKDREAELKMAPTARRTRSARWRARGRRPVQRRASGGRASASRTRRSPPTAATSPASRTRRTCRRSPTTSALVDEKDKKLPDAIKDYDSFITTYAQGHAGHRAAALRGEATASSCSTRRSSRTPPRWRSCRRRSSPPTRSCRRTTTRTPSAHARLRPLPLPPARADVEGVHRHEVRLQGRRPCKADLAAKQKKIQRGREGLHRGADHRLR